MPASLICMGHGGPMNTPGLLTPEEEGAVDAQIDLARHALRSDPPDLVIQFGNDHNSGFSLRMMPPFLIGLRARTLGDFGTSAAPMTVDELAGRALVRDLHDQGVDVATAYDALFDHGITMALDRLFGGVDKVPVIPVFTNCGGDLRPPLARSLALGTAIGSIVRKSWPNKNVLFLGSGGLSHDPPLPDFETSPPDVQEKMIAGTSWTAETLLARTERVAEVAREHGRGEGPLQPLNPEWDAAMMDAFAEGDLESVAAQSDAEVMTVGGRGAAEIRNWLSAFAALREASGGYRVAQHFYRALPAWIAGWGLMRAVPA